MKPAFKLLLKSQWHRELVAVALAMAVDGGHTIAWLSTELGISKTALRKLTALGRLVLPGGWGWIPRVHLFYVALALDGRHTHPSVPRDEKWVCLECGASNFEGHPKMQPSADDPPPEPKKRYRPGRLRGGISKDKG